MSKARLDDLASAPVSPAQVIDLAVAQGCPSVAMTYNDPVIWAEFAIDIAKEARARGVRSVLVTAGYVTAEARPELYANIDAANVDLKAFTEDFYHKVTFSHLDPVLETLKWIKHETNVWLEITNLMIPGLNDDEAETRKLAEWVGAELGDDVPLHFTAFHPDFKMRDIPPTPPSTLTRARAIAREVGLKYVYTGNVHDRAGGTTLCPSCAAPVIERDWYAIESGRPRRRRQRQRDLPRVRRAPSPAASTCRRAPPTGAGAASASSTTRRYCGKSRRLRVVSFGRIRTGSERLILNSGFESSTVCLPAGSFTLTGVGPLSTPSTFTLHHGLDANSSVPSPSSLIGVAGSGFLASGD